MQPPAEPAKDCPTCQRLVEFRTTNRELYPECFNGAVPSFGSDDARFVVVGLAPGLKGANCSGRPFTGDAAGVILYASLIEFGFAKGVYDARPNDGLHLVDAMITNAVRCVPPKNKPVGGEINACRTYLKARLASLPCRRVTLALGRIAHESVIRALEQKPADFPFKHGARYTLGDGTILFDSYHCSRYNLNTRRLTEDMFKDVFSAIRVELDQ